jgi:hypothetical protein
VEVEVCLKEKDGHPVFTASGTVWNSKRTDCLWGGQCLDRLNNVNALGHNHLFGRIYRLWKLYHLNDTHPGTQEQEAALKKHFGSDFPNFPGYNEYCNYLKSIGMYEVMHEGKPYKYGHGWIYYPIPEEDLKEMMGLIIGDEKMLKYNWREYE